jgi:NAD(P)-dependent dehydrogenase (short-subunit alcohol dehydrogenase family)
VGDVTDPGCPSRAATLATETFGGLDGLANVAGLVVNGTAITTTDQEFDRAMAVNVVATMRFIRAALPAMIDRGSGSIVNLSSVVGVRGRQDGLGYVTAKAAVLGLTRSVALDFGRAGVRCNSVSPGAVDTPMLRTFDARNPGVLDQLAADSYLGRVADGADIASVCRFLLSRESAFVNGADLVVDGGSLAAFGPPRQNGWDPTRRVES